MSASIRSLMGLIAKSTQLLTEEGIDSDRDYARIEAANNCFGGSGLRIVDARNLEVARTIASILIPTASQLALVYFTVRPQGVQIFCGEAHQDRSTFERLTHEFAAAAEEEEQEEAELYQLADGESIILEAELQAVLEEVLPDDADDIEMEFIPDGDGPKAICLEQLPDESSAIEIQRELFWKLPEHRLFARFPWEEYWTLYCQAEAPGE